MEPTTDEIAAEKRRQQDFDDLQNEMGGVETGRIHRFLTHDVNTPEGRRKKREQEAFESRLMRMLQDPVYLAKYNETMDALRDAEQKTEAALDRIEQLISKETQSLNDMEDRAARLPGDTLVFRDAGGTVRTADGQAVEDHLADTILWTGNEPSFEAYQDQHQKLDHLKNAHRETEHYRDDVLGAARDRMSDEDNPSDKDELDAIMQDINEKMPKSVHEFAPGAEINNAPEPASTFVQVPDVVVKP